MYQLVEQLREPVPLDDAERQDHLQKIQEHVESMKRGQPEQERSPCADDNLGYGKMSPYVLEADQEHQDAMAAEQAPTSPGRPMAQPHASAGPPVAHREPAQFEGPLVYTDPAQATKTIQSP